MPLSAASDLGLHCLHVSHKKDASLIWVNIQYSAIIADSRCNLGNEMMVGNVVNGFYNISLKCELNRGRQITILAPSYLFR